MALSLRVGGVTRIGPYQLLARIGEGGMGTVYLAKMEGGLAGVNKLAVVKVLRADLVDSPEFVEMFLDEARLAARLTHPNVVHTYGADDADGRLYIAMEHLDGQPWARVRHRLWANRTLPLAMHLKVLADTLAGLHYAHELVDFSGQPLDVVHCDMSPQNVFVTYDGQVKVVDFGVARAAHFSRGLRPDLFFGKLSYCAPEQARGEPVDRRADVFSVGVMLWEALTGRRFARGNDTSEIRRVRVAGTEPRAREVAPRIPRVLGDICDRALSIEPADRFGTAAEFREQLMTYLVGHWRDSDGQQLGALVAEAFEPERDRLYGLVQRRLDDPAAADAPIEDLLDNSEGSLLGENTLPADLSQLASVSLSAEDAIELSEEHTRPTNSERVAVKAPRGVWLLPTLAAVAVLGLAAGAVLMSSSSKDAGPGAAPGATTAAHAATAAAEREDTPQPKAPTTAAGPVGAAGTSDRAAGRDDSVPDEAQPARVQLVLSASPLRATLVLDGRRLSSNPYAAKVAADDREHVLSAQADGYVAGRTTLRFEGEQQLVKLELEREPSGDSARERRRRRARAEAARKAEAAREAAAEASPAPPAAPPVPDDEPEAEPDGPEPDRPASREIYDEVPF